MMSKIWPTCDKTQLQKHLDEYEFRLDCYETNPEPEDRYTGDPEEDRKMNIDAHCYRIKTLQELINKLKVEIKEYV